MRLSRHVLASCLLCTLAGTASAQAPSRPDSLGLEANITFLYFRDIPRAQRFYEDVLGLTLTVDQGYSKIYRVSPTSYVGLVDESRGLHRASRAKPVTLSFVSSQVDAWYAYLRQRGVEMVHELADGTRQPTRGFVAKDPEGYYLEFETFRDDPQNATIRPQLARAGAGGVQREAMAFVDGLLRRYVGQFRPDGNYPEGWTPEQIIEADLSPVLREALAADRAAAVKSPDEIVGLDFDPFVNAQDFCTGYEARAVAVRDSTTNVAVYNTCAWGDPLVPDAVYNLARRDGRWIIVDISYPGGPSLLQLLANLAKERNSP